MKKFIGKKIFGITCNAIGFSIYAGGKINDREHENDKYIKYRL